jgi:site-specific recombinase XerD
VTAAIGAESSKRDYARELRQFFAWYERVGFLHPAGFHRSTVMAYRESMQDAGRGAVSINKALCAIRALAREAGANGYMAGDEAARIEQVPQVERRGGKLGNWLSSPN